MANPVMGGARRLQVQALQKKGKYGESAASVDTLQGASSGLKKGKKSLLKGKMKASK